MRTLFIASAVAVLLAIIVPATYMELKARRRLSPLGEENPWRAYFWFLAGQQYFTAEGWRYRQRATHLSVLGGAVFLALVLIALRFLRGGA